MLKTLPCWANQVSVQPPLSHIRIGAVLLTTRSGFRKSSMFSLGKRNLPSRPRDRVFFT
jgi:hypothetical protein